MPVKILLDSADPVEWRKWLPQGIFSGITTNPSLLLEAKQSCTLLNIHHLAKIAETIKCEEIHLQAWGEDEQTLERNGLGLAEIREFCSSEINIKIPMTFEGVKVAKKLIDRGIRITLTGCYETKQVLIADAIGAKNIAPYLGRINDLGENGLSTIIRMQTILSALDSSCSLLVASIRDCREIAHLAKHGVKTFTIRSNIALDLFNVESTILAAKKFQEDATKMQ